MTGWRVTPQNLVYHVDNASGAPVEGFPGNVLECGQGPGEQRRLVQSHARGAAFDVPGVIDLDFSPPLYTGVSAQVISPITAQTTVAGISNSTIIHVHSSTNTVTVLIGYPNIPVPVGGPQ